jgi:hypothetical protein
MERVEYLRERNDNASVIESELVIQDAGTLASVVSSGVFLFSKLLDNKETIIWHVVSTLLVLRRSTG